jgi:1-acyl-sn-glycerol-3-phosphate acyltransferase
MEVEGRQYIPKKGGFILASNHLSYLDPVALGVACPRKLNFMARHDLFSNPLFSKFISSLGAFPIKRNSADLSALKEAIKRLKDGKALVLFPEGRRKDRISVITEPQLGIGFLVKKTRIPVVPALIKGTDKALPKGARFIIPKKISVHFGKQIQIKRDIPYGDIAQKIMEDILRLGKVY